MKRTLLLALVLAGCDDGGGDDPAPDVLETPIADAAMDPDVGPTPDLGTSEPDAAAPDPDAGTGPADAGPDALADAGPPLMAACNDGLGDLPEGLEIIEYHDGQGVADVSTQEWTIVGAPIASSTLHEAVRFALPHPARIYGFSIQYGALPSGDETPLTAGLYDDFGHNGFDFWAQDPLWTGSRCRADAAPGRWMTFALDAPIEVSEPGLVYVAHKREDRGAAWLFDGTRPNEECMGDCCEQFANCHSAWNFPTLRTFESGGQQNYAWNGLSLSFELDYMVRLYVEYTEQQAPEEKLFQPEPDVPPLSNRMAWGDYDNDGDDDLVVNGPRLLRNDDGVFSDVSEAAGLVLEGVGGSGVWGDYDNDGCLDLFLFDESNARGDRLLRSDCEGAFVDMTEAAGFDDSQDYNDCDGAATHSPTPAAAWVDIDADGLLDLYLANFICWTDYTFYTDTVWHNEGDGTFAEWTGQNGFRSLDQAPRSSRGVSPIDADGDGDVDIFVNSYTLNPNKYFENNGDGTVSHVAREANLTGNATARGLQTTFGHSIGAAWGDLDGDGLFDLVVANLAHPRFWDFSDKTQVLLNNGDGTFRETQGDFEYPAGAAGIRYQETHSVPVLADFDQDGDLDLSISAIYDGRPTDFYWGDGDGTFTAAHYDAGIMTLNGWGMAAADFDLDGDMDLVTRDQLYRNTHEGGHWLQVKAVGNVVANRAALGATVRVIAGERRWIRAVNGGTGQGCQDSLYLHFGLGDAASVDAIEVRFPGSDAPVRYDGPFDADQRVWVYEDGTTGLGWTGNP